MVAVASTLTGLGVESVAFPPSVKPPGSANTFFLGGAGVRGILEDGIFNKYSVIGVYLEDSALPWLAAKWKSKTAEELTESLEFFKDIITGPFEKFYRVTLVFPMTGSKFVEKVEENSIIIMKSAGVYGDEESKAVKDFVDLFKTENRPPNTGFSIIYTQSPTGTLTVRFSNDESIPEAGNVVKNKALSEAVLDSIIGKEGVSPAAKRSLAERLSKLLKELNADSTA